MKWSMVKWLIYVVWMVEMSNAYIILLEEYEGEGHLEDLG
jgi:hypothetical protein